MTDLPAAPVAAPAVPVPPHVPPGRVVDFDLFAPPGAEVDLHRAWAALAEAGELVWTPHNGGHWIATRAELIELMQNDSARFSHERFSLPRSATDAGVIPLGFDPPRHTPFRHLIMQAFHPRAVRAMEEVARTTAIELIEALRPKGACEFIGDFAQVLPVNVFLEMADLPQADRPRLLALADGAVRASDPEEKTAAYAAVAEYIGAYVAARAQSPGEDVMSRVATAQIEGRPIAFEESVGVALLLLLGGLDTVASQLGFVAKFLAESPAHRRQLIDDPALAPAATEEFLRRFAIVNTARLVTADVELGGVTLKAGDMVQLPKSLAALDADRHPDPWTVDFTRRTGGFKQPAFGSGVHTCPGSGLARREIAVFLTEWLARIPDFTVDAGRPLRIASGMVNTVTELHLRW